VLLKIAHFAAQKGDYKKAIELFEKVSVASLDVRLLQYSVKDYLFKASICHLVIAAEARDISTLSSVLDRYKDMQPSFDNSREVKLIDSLIQCYRDDAVDKFTDLVFNYDKIYRLDNWSSSLLLKIKQALRSNVPQKIELDSRNSKTRKGTGSSSSQPVQSSNEPDLT